MTNQQNAPMSKEPARNLVKEGGKLGILIGFMLSISYAVVGFLAVEVFGEGMFGEGVEFSPPIFKSIVLAEIIWVVLVIFVIITVILLLAIAPATVIGSLTGMCLGKLAKFAQSKHMSNYLFVLLCSLFCSIVVILMHLLFQISITLSFDPPSYEFPHVGTYSSYLFRIGIPSIIYIFTGGWVGQQLYSSKFVKKQWFSIRYPKLFVLAFLGVSILFVGLIIFKPKTEPETSVLSLQDHWELLESGGQDWQSDAYPIDIWFYPNRGLPKIYAIYLSESTPNVAYSIEIDKKSRISHKVIDDTYDTYDMRESAKLPIKRDDWEIGSTQAWDMFMQIESVNSCLEPSEEKAFFSMLLSRIKSGRLAWQLSISNCSTVSEYSYYYLDAKTGETIESFFEE